MKRNIVAVIPAKANSNRVPNKNFRPFYGNKSLLEIKIEQCVSSKIFSSVYVSSDSADAKPVSENSGATFILRDPYYCLDSTPWGEVLEGVMNSLPVHEDTLIAWCMPTSPLFDRFNDFFNFLENNPDQDSAVTVTKLTHYYLNSDFIPINHKWGPWHTYSQGTKPIYHLNLACFLTTKKQIIKNQYLIGSNPCFFPISQTEGFDIDTMEEFEVSQILFERKNKSAK